MDTKQISWPGWETTRLIGSGSFGAVYEIQRKLFEDDEEPEKAALKVISIPQNDSDIEEMYSDGYDEESVTSTFHTHLKSIVAEYSLMRKMNGSSNIVNCDDVRYVQHDDGIGWDIYIKMELLTPLTKALPGTASEEQVTRIAMDMCSALELCGRHNIVHRDIKPQNIFVSENGDYKLGDFGIAKTVEKTMGGTKTGTYKYMAPEVYNNRPYNSTADIYSLGLVLYWLLNERRMPFMPLPPEKLRPGMDEESRNRRLSGERIPAPKNGSEALKAIVLKACAFEPKNRYQSAREMREELLRLSGGYVPASDFRSMQKPEIAEDMGLVDDATVGPNFKRNATMAVDDLEKTVGPHFSVREEKSSQNILLGQMETQKSVNIKEQKQKCKDKKKLWFPGILLLMLVSTLLVILVFNSQQNEGKTSTDVGKFQSGGQEPSEERNDTEYSVVIDLAEIEIGQETNVAFLLNEYTYRSDEDLQWESSNPLVATVTQDGRVTGISEGQVTIVGTLNGLTSSVSITVRSVPTTVSETVVYQPPLQISELQVDCITDILLVGDTVDAFATSDSWYFSGNSEGLAWSIDDTSIAAVDSQGRVTGKRSGKCQLRVEYQGLTSTMEITVVEVDSKSKVTTALDYERLSLRAGNSDTVSLAVSGELPENCGVLAYYSAGLQLWLKWGETSNPLELTITLEHWTEPEGYVTILIYDEDNPTHIVATEKVYIRTN